MNELHFTPILRLLGMIGKWTKTVDSYTEKLADSLEKHGFAVDAKCVREHLRARRGEPVARATQDATDAEKVTISRWVARDGDGELNLFTSPPSREEEEVFEGVWIRAWSGYTRLKLPNYFPSVTWESEPVKVKIEISKDE